VRFPKLAVLAAFLASLAGVPNAEEVLLEIGTWPPFTDEGIPGHGIATEIVNAALERAGFVPRYAFVPWKRAEADVGIGTAFATFPFLKIPEREEAFLFSDPLFTSGFALAYSRSRPPSPDFALRSLEDLRGYGVGIIAGSNAVGYPLTAAGARVVEAQTPDRLAAMLAGGRVDFIVEEALVLREMVRPYGTSFTVMEIPFWAGNQYRLMTSKRYPGSTEMLERFNRALAEITGDGTLAEIISRFDPR